MAINTKLLYDVDGFCRLCSERNGAHTQECPGLILDNLLEDIRVILEHNDTASLLALIKEEAQRLREVAGASLSDYATKGSENTDPVVVDDDPMPPRTPEELEQYADAYFRLGNRAVPPWEAREKAWHERHRRA